MNNDELRYLFKIKKTQIEVMIYRGLYVRPIENDLISSLQNFVTIIENYKQARQESITRNLLSNPYFFTKEETDLFDSGNITEELLKNATMVCFLPTIERKDDKIVNKLPKVFLVDKINDFSTRKIKKMIFISELEYDHECYKTVNGNDFKSLYSIQLLLDKNLIFNPLLNEQVPRHYLLKRGSKEFVDVAIQIKRKSYEGETTKTLLLDLPILDSNDIISKLLGAEEGDIMKIKISNEGLPVIGETGYKLCLVRTLEQKKPVPKKVED